MRHRSGIAGWTVLCLQLFFLPGCSFWAVRGPNPSAIAGGDCSTSVAAPVVDGVLAASFIGLGAAGAAAQSCSGTSSSASFGFGPCFLDFSAAEQQAGVGLIVIGVIEAAAATYGAIQVNACHQAKKGLETTAGHSAPTPAFRVGAHPDPWPLTGEGASR
jgi:cytochrome b561